MALVYALAAAFGACVLMSSGLKIQNVDAGKIILPSSSSRRPPVHDGLPVPPISAAAHTMPLSPNQTDFSSNRSIFDAMWAGLDPLFENTNVMLDTANLRPFASLRSFDEHVVLLGPMDSGTHLLYETLSRNFPDEFESACQGTTQSCKWIWKHSVGIDGIVQVLASSTANALDRTTIIAIVRSPFAQLASWREDPRDMEDCVSRWWSNMTKPCSSKLGATLPEDHLGLASSVVPELNFSSTVDVINQYYAQYTLLQKLGLFKQVLVLRYEDLLYAPTAMTNRLGFHLGWSVPSNVLIPDGGVKKSSSYGRASAIGAVRQRSYLDKIPTAAMSVLCGLLDQTVQSELKFVEVGSADIDGEPFSLAPQYMSDCNLGAF